MVAWLERRQIWLYLAGLATGVLFGLGTPAIAPAAQAAILPVLAALLYATFLGIPVAKMAPAFQDRKFLGVVVLLNFLIVPMVVFGLSRIVAHDGVLLVGVLCVLLTPCIDYVIAFAGLAGGDARRLLATAPVLMMVQMLLLPLYLWAFLGAGFLRAVEFGPFVEAFLWIIFIPFLLALMTQKAAVHWRWAQALNSTVNSLMVPLMMLTLATVVASQIAGVGSHLSQLLAVVPVYVLFAVIMVPIGMLLGRTARLGVGQQRSVVFSGVTRNSLVILPLVLALPDYYSLAALVVVTQTLVELVTMVVLVKLVPRLIPERTATSD